MSWKTINYGRFAYNPYRINVGSISLLKKDTDSLISPACVIFKIKL